MTELTESRKFSPWQIVQSILTGLVLLVASGIWGNYNKQLEAAQAQEKEMVLLQANQITTSNKLSSIETQMSALTQISISVAKIEVKLEDDENKIREIQGVKRVTR